MRKTYLKLIREHLLQLEVLRDHCELYINLMYINLGNDFYMWFDLYSEMPRD